MPIEEIPTGVVNEGAFEQRTDLDGASFVFRFWWNARAERWFMDLYDEERSPIATGLKLVPNTDLIENLRGDNRRPSGFIMALDIQSQGDTPRTPISPTLNDLGQRVKVVYFAAEQRAAMGL